MKPQRKHFDVKKKNKTQKQQNNLKKQTPNLILLTSQQRLTQTCNVVLIFLLHINRHADQRIFVSSIKKEMKLIKVLIILID